jgi:hypothetical protein
MMGRLKKLWTGCNVFQVSYHQHVLECSNINMKSHLYGYLLLLKYQAKVCLPQGEEQSTIKYYIA